MRRLALASALLLTLLLATVPARAGAALRSDATAGERIGRIELAAPPATVRAGEVVTLRWTVRGGAPEELELLLSLDDGRTFPLRVSPQLEGHQRVYRWRVPDVVASAARLRARMGDEQGEVDGPPSEAFRIEPSDDGHAHGGLVVRVGGPRTGARAERHEDLERGSHAAPEPLVHEGGWWDDHRHARGGAGAGLSGAHEDTFSTGALPPAAAPDHRAPRDVPPPPSTEDASLTATTSMDADRLLARPADARPMRIPLRN